jgi:hypothetical protein
MNSKILAIILAIAVIAIPAVVSADSPPKDKVYDVKIKVGDKVKISKDVEATFKGYDSKSKKPIWTSTVEAPIYIDRDTKIDNTWKVSKGIYTSGANLFTAVVKGEAVSIDKGELTWLPDVELVYADTGRKVVAKYKGTTLIKDYINSNYGMNTLRLTYEAGEFIFYRDLRLIEGVLCEYYKFDTNPNADIYIVQNAEGKIDRFASATAWDANYKKIEVESSWNRKTVYAKQLKDVVFPVIIDPSPTYYTSASDGYAANSGTGATGADAIASARNKTTSYIGTSSTAMPVYYWGYNTAGGQPCTPTVYLERAYLYFDTSALPNDATITGATLSLYSVNKGLNNSAFTVFVTNGQPTYPHDPLQSADWTITGYSGNGGEVAYAAIAASGYTAITLNATGIGWINTTGTTKLSLINKEFDYNQVFENGTDASWWQFYAYEQGVGYRPKIDVTYTSELPTAVTNDATGVACTTAILNGNLTNNGGDAVTKQGFVWDITSRAEPSSATTPALSAYASNDIHTEAGGYAIGIYSHALAALTEGDTYYARFVTYNSNGYKYSNEITFTCWSDPVIITQPATGVGTTTANLQSQITSFGGDYCEVRFGYGTTDQGVNIAAYDHFSVYSGVYETGAHPLESVSGLTANTLYYFNVQAQNDCGATTGTARSFTTESAVGSPTNVIAIPTANTVTLTWSKGTGATNTVIRFKVNSCPASETDGTLLYDSTAATYVHTGLTAGTDYCYYVRGYESSIGYSTNSVTIHATTLAGVAATGTYAGVPTQPSGWSIEPNSTNIASKNPAAPYIADIATSTGVPLDYLWFLLTMVAITGAAFITYKVSHHTIPTAIVIIIGMSIGTAVSLVSVYLTVITAFICAGIIIMEVRKTV